MSIANSPATIIEQINALNLVKKELGKPYEDLEFLLQAFDEVLKENGEVEIAQQIPWINETKPFDPEYFTERHIQLYSLIFQLMNMVEIVLLGMQNLVDLLFIIED